MAYKILERESGLEKVEKILAKYSTKCKVCENPIDDETTGIREVKNGFVCDDCYFEEWGRLVEEHPICSPRRV